MGADRALSRKGKLLYDYIREKGGGALEEWRMRDKTGLSHGSFCAARKELVEAGLLLLGKDVRKTTYTLRELTCQKPACRELTCQEMTSQELNEQAAQAAASPLMPAVKDLAAGNPLQAVPPAGVVPPPPPVSVVRGKSSGQRKRPACKPAKPPAEVQEAIMPRVTGDFPDFDSWLLELNDTLGDCVDVSQSLVDGQEYIVFAEEYGEDTYTITESDDGGISVE